MRDGRISEAAATTCRGILAAFPGSGNGMRWLDFDAHLPNVPRAAFCDMVNGGWTYADQGTPFRLDYTGASQTLTTIPVEAEYLFTLYGAAGGEGNNQDGGAGGRALGSGTFAPGTTLVVEVGGQGDAGGVEDQGPGSTRGGGYNGGGRGTKGGSGGGGATDLRTVAGDLDSRILVAGGGGGCGNGACSSSGGDGGGLTGENGNGGSGGGQNAGGNPNGAFGRGGDNVQDNDEGGGGGGWYGGGAGGSPNTSGGGGSSYYDGMDGDQTTTAGVNPGDGYAEYIFR